MSINTDLFATQYAENVELLNRALFDAKTVVTTVQANLSDAELSQLLSQSELSSIEEARVLRQALKRTQDLAFGEGCDVGISSGKLNRTSKKLTNALESFFELERAVESVSSVLAEEFPGFKPTEYKKAALALFVLVDRDSNPAKGSARERAGAIGLPLLEALRESGRIELLLFVCPPVEFEYLKSDQPELYIRTSMEQSLLARQMKELIRLNQSLDKVGVEWSLKALIGDNDEREYIFPVLDCQTKLSEDQLTFRKSKLKQSVESYLLDRLGGANLPKVEVVSLSQAGFTPRAEYMRESVSEKFKGYYLDIEIDQEKSRMLELWRPGSYYDGIPCPINGELDKIVALKFAAYAAQGVFIAERYPNCLLIQTEFPSRLRTKMLNVGRRELGLPALDGIYLSYSE